MATFSYLAMDSAGAERRGEVEAADSRDAAQILRLRSLFVLEISDGGLRRGGLSRFTGSVRGIFKGKVRSRLLPVTAMDFVFLYRQIALMLGSGYTVVQALEISGDIIEKHSLAKSVKRMAEAIRNGMSFSQALAGERRMFSPLESNLVASGEASGELEMVLERLGDNVERTVEVKRQMVTALIYPGIVFILAIAVATYMLVKFIPDVSKFFTNRKMSIPWHTQFFIDVSNAVIDYGPYIVGAILGLIVLALAASTRKSGKKVLDNIALRVPLVGKTVVIAAMAQFGLTMAMLLRSGLTVLEALRILVSVSKNSAIGGSFDKVGESILSGRNLTTGLDQRHIPHLVRHMATVGEQSGELEKVMGDLGQYYGRLLESRVKMIVAIVKQSA